jgi:hypothetical protein
VVLGVAGGFFLCFILFGAHGSILSVGVAVLWRCAGVKGESVKGESVKGEICC